MAKKIYPSNAIVGNVISHSATSTKREIAEIENTQFSIVFRFTDGGMGEQFSLYQSVWLWN